jgi:hypothetical protein
MANPESSNHCPTILDEIQNEVDRQKRYAWDDSFNNPGLWAAYIANYATRWAMPRSFRPEKYSFRQCMIKVAALAISAIEWADTDACCKDTEERIAKVNANANPGQVPD